MSIRVLAAAVMTAFSFCVLAAPPTGPIVDTLKAINAAADIQRIGETPISGLKEVIVDGTVIYFSEDGRYLVQGQILDVKDHRNLTDIAKAALRKDLLSVADLSNAIRFAPEKPLYDVWVFTDVDCGYCRKLHEEIASYNAAGVAVNYLAFPRSGLGTEGYTKAVNIWCSDDRPARLTEAKAGKAIPTAECKDSVGEMFALGQKLGVSGTPAIFTADGTQLGGYLPADAMVQRLSAMTALSKP